MVKPEEIRKGNIISDLFGQYHVVSGDTIMYLEQANDEQTKNVKPIELTEDLLLKCGFKKGMLKYIFNYQETFFQVAITSIKNGAPNKFIFRGLGASVVEVKYLHHLQNIIHALTGQELDTSKII